MNRFLDSSTAGQPLGLPTGQKCLKISDGQYTGKTALLYASSASTIKLIAADPPYSTPSEPINVVTDSADSPFDAWMGENGDIYVAYSIASTFNLGFVKLAFSGGLWSPGTPVIVFNADQSYYPSIRKLTSGQVWIVYTRLSGGNYYISAKESTDDGATWGTVSDPGDTLTAGTDEAYSRLVELNNFQFVFYADGGDRMAFKAKANSSSVWSGETILASEGGYSEHFSARATTDGRIGLAYVSNSGLKFREFTGSYWTGEAEIDTGNILSPVDLYLAGEAYILYGKDMGDGMVKAFFSRRENDEFVDPEALDVRKAELKSLLVYNSSAGTYEDKTAEAISATTGDIFHSTSSALLSAEGDILFLGIDEPFNFLRILLSTSGTGGDVVWKYWDSQIWKAFVPASGSWSFADAAKDLLMWTDYDSIPGDWQKKTVSGATCFWVSVSVSSAFTIAPVGSRITAISDLNLLSLQV